MDPMRSASARSSLAAILAMLGGVYPLMILAEAMAWPLAIRGALAVLALVVMIGVKLALMDFDEWRQERRQWREERDERRRMRSARHARRRDGAR